MFESTEAYAKNLDAKDPLRAFRNRFYLDEKTLYMDGNSLGLMSKDAEASILRVMEEWRTLGINGWMGGKPPWFFYAEGLGKRMAGLVGAHEDEVIIHSSTTVNLHIGLSTFYRPTQTRYKILMDELNFPSDVYAVSSHLKMHGIDPSDALLLAKSSDGKMLEEDDIIAMMTEEVSLILLPGVLYRSGQLLDMERLTKAAHEKGIYVLFDLSHSAGAVEHHLSDWDVDCAFWCGYKYLSNGPGGVASLYINRRHFDKETGIAGWFGYNKEKQFDMTLDFEQAHSAGGFQVGTPHLLSMAPLEGSLTIFEEAGMKALREKSLKATDYMIEMIEERLLKYGFTVGTPKSHEQRGGHVALEHDDAVRINEAMKARGIIPDFRFPNVIRLAPVPLYVSFHEIYRMVIIIEEIMENKDYEKHSTERPTVA
jgi:kynureninase